VDKKRGYATAYLWHDILKRENLGRIRGSGYPSSSRR